MQSLYIEMSDLIQISNKKECLTCLKILIEENEFDEQSKVNLLKIIEKVTSE